MARYLLAEVEEVKTSEVKIDIDKFLASDWGREFNPEQDEEVDFIRGCLWEIGTSDLLDHQAEDEHGIAVIDGYDDSSIRLIGQVEH